jgi:hypothetical protein
MSEFDRENSLIVTCADPVHQNWNWQQTSAPGPLVYVAFVLNSPKQRRNDE